MASVNELGLGLGLGLEFGLNEFSNRIGNEELLAKELAKEIANEKKRILDIYEKLTEQEKNELFDSHLVRNIIIRPDDSLSSFRKTIILGEIIERQNSCLYAMSDLLEKIKK